MDNKVIESVTFQLVDGASEDAFIDAVEQSSRYLRSYFRTYQPPFLTVWGKNDPAFLPAGAEAYRRDLPQAEIHYLDTGHFALDTHASEIAAFMRRFLNRKLRPTQGVVDGNSPVSESKCGGAERHE